MSALFNANGKYLTATLSSPPTESEARLVVAWMRKPASLAFGSDNRAITLYDSADSLVYQRIAANATPLFTTAAINGGGGSTIANGAVVNDTWHQVGLYLGPNAAGQSNRIWYLDGVKAGPSGVTTSTDTGRLIDLIRIGCGLSDTTARWRGYIAEVAVFKPSSEANADAIMAELATLKPNAISSGTPVWYASLESDASSTGGVITNNGSTTFDSGVHPAVGTGQVTVNITPDPTTVSVGGARTFTLTRSTAAGVGGAVYNLATGNAGIATVPATATIAEGQTQTTFDATGVAAGTTTITATNQADALETDSASITVSATAVKGVRVQLFNAADDQNDLTGLSVAWWDSVTPSTFGAPVHKVANESTDANGWLEVDLDAVTALDYGQSGTLLVYKAGATPEADIAFFGRIAIQDIA